ncbi:MAG: hypothetical protein ACI38A_05885 [Candidatus Ornithomonoglobus sp.]
MSYYLPSLIATYIFVIVLWICMLWRILNRRRKAELLRERREAARAAEDEEFDYIMRLRIELERAQNMPVGVHGRQKKPIRKAVGLFSDSDAQMFLARKEIKNES